MVDVLLYADLSLNEQFTDAELRAWFPKLAQWKIKLALEVGAIKEWGETGAETFRAEQPMWDRMQRLGGPIYAVAMDEPLSAARSLKKSDDYAVQETASFVTLVRRHDPQMLIGDIEPYPSVPLSDHLRWIDALQARLAQNHVRGLDFYRMDVDWLNFVVGNPGSWPEVVAVEHHCRARSCPSA